MDRRKNRRATRGALALLGGLALLELRKLPAARTWHGRALGVIPYDLRPPTAARVRERWWNPDDPRLFTPQSSASAGPSTSGGSRDSSASPGPGRRGATEPPAFGAWRTEEARRRVRRNGG